MVNNTKVLRLIGLAMRAGKVKFGSDSCMEAIIQNKIKVLSVAKDASERTKTIIGVCDDNFSKEIIKILSGGEVIG